MGNIMGEAFSRLRRARGLSLRETAKLAAVDPGYLCRLEGGAKRRPTEAVLRRLLRVLSPTKQQERVIRFLAGEGAPPDSVWRVILAELGGKERGDE